MANTGGKLCDPLGDVLVLDFSPDEPLGMLPSFFYRQYSEVVPMNSVLIDPLGNVNTVAVEKIGNHAFFTEGWSFLGRFYGIQDGAWICLVYVGDATFNIKIRTHKWLEWIYPPIPEPLVGVAGSAGINMVIGDEELLLANNMRFPFSMIKWVSFGEFTGDVLTISSGFYVPALIDPESQVYIVDEYGRLWPCFLRRSFGGQSDDCVLTKGWARFCRSKGIQQGQKIMFGVTYPKSNKLHYIPVV